MRRHIKGRERSEGAKVTYSQWIHPFPAKNIYYWVFFAGGGGGGDGGGFIFSIVVSVPQEDREVLCNCVKKRYPLPPYFLTIYIEM